MTIRSLGDGYFTSVGRVYRNYKENGKVINKLISWSVNRCAFCGHFLNKYNSGYRCDRCKEKSKHGHVKSLCLPNAIKEEMYIES